MARSRRSLVLALLLPAALLGAACLGGADLTPSANDDPAAIAEVPATTPDPATDSPASPDATPGAPEPQGTGAGLAAEAESDASGEETPAGPVAAPRGEPEHRDPEATDRETPEPAANDPPPAPLDVMIFIQPAQVRPGQVFLIAIDTRNASAASVALDGQFISLAREGDRFYTILPVPFETPPGRLNMVVAVADLSGELAVQELLAVEVLPAASIVELIEIDASLSRLLDPAVVAEDRAIRDAVQRVRSPLRFWNGYFQLPTAGVITSGFGLLRSYNGAEPTDYHSGLDFAGALGDDVVAANAGVVAWTGETERRGRGVIIDHGGGIFSSYWHLSSIATESGDPVAAGTLIGRVGTTGLSTGSHLHWEISVHGVPVDPLPWLRELEVPNPLAVFDPARAVNHVARTTTGS